VSQWEIDRAGLNGEDFSGIDDARSTLKIRCWRRIIDWLIGVRVKQEETRATEVKAGERKTVESSRVPESARGANEELAAVGRSALAHGERKKKWENAGTKNPTAVHSSRSTQWVRKMQILY
jgi:hypothetical protein